MTSTVISIFFFNDTATTEIYTLSLHDALPICAVDCSAAPISCLRACESRCGSSPQTDTRPLSRARRPSRSEEHTSELQSQSNLVCRLLLEEQQLMMHSIVDRPLVFSVDELTSL